MSKRKVLTGFAAAMLVLSGCAKNRSGESMGSGAGSATADLVALRAEETRPLGVGDRAPNATLSTPDGTNTQFRKVAAASPTILIFYRGGWCPYCNTALGQWNNAAAEITAMGAQLIAITTEKPDDANRTTEKNGLDFEIYVDDKLNASRAFHVLFDIAPETKELYLSKYNLDVAKFNASKTWQLPHPGTFIVDSRGIVRYAHVDADYKAGRDKPENVIAALQTMKEQTQ
jgi:peroxiredoxin